MTGFSRRFRRGADVLRSVPKRGASGSRRSMGATSGSDAGDRSRSAGAARRGRHRRKAPTPAHAAARRQDRTGQTGGDPPFTIAGRVTKRRAGGGRVWDNGSRSGKRWPPISPLAVDHFGTSPAAIRAQGAR